MGHRFGIYCRSRAGRVYTFGLFEDLAAAKAATAGAAAVMRRVNGEKSEAEDGSSTPPTASVLGKRKPEAAARPASSKKQKRTDSRSGKWWAEFKCVYYRTSSFSAIVRRRGRTERRSGFRSPVDAAVAADELLQELSPDEPVNFETEEDLERARALERLHTAGGSEEEGGSDSDEEGGAS